MVPFETEAVRNTGMLRVGLFFVSLSSPAIELSDGDILAILVALRKLKL